MAFIASHDSVAGHPKTLDLMCRMGWDEDTVIGKLHRFWWWCLKYAPSGDLRKYNDAILAGSVGLAPEEGSRFVAAMVESRWIDRGKNVFRVHHWLHYAGRYLQDSLYRRHPELWAEAQEVHAVKMVASSTTVRRQSADKSLTDGDRERDTNPPTTREAEDAASAAGESAGFAEFWSAFPPGGRKADKGGCLKVWKSRKLHQSVAVVLEGLRRWKSSAEWAREGGRFVPAPIVWLRQARWEAHPEPTSPEADASGFVRRELTPDELRADIGLTDEQIAEMEAM